jgi:ubiquinone/menaquinone biosynthesis C-methylase UbiE
MAKQFFPGGAIDYSGRMSARYQSGRMLSPEAADTWAAIVAPFIRQGTNTRILDLVAGTGRFSELFARVFEAYVVGVEPSTGMLVVANGSAYPKRPCSLRSRGLASSAFALRLQELA